MSLAVQHTSPGVYSPLLSETRRNTELQALVPAVYMRSNNDKTCISVKHTNSDQNELLELI
jgi:hypothetical protein